MKPLHIYPLLLIVALSFSCSKEKPEPPTYYLTQDMYDYVIFPVGSWWVYKDSVTGVLDTVKVVSQARKIEDYDWESDGNVDEKFEEVYLSSSKSYPSNDTSQFINTASEYSDNKTCRTHIIIKTRQGETGVNVYLGNILPKDKTIYSYINYFLNIDTLNLNNLNFFHIKLFLIKHILDGSTNDFVFNETSKHDGTYYYAKSVGLIKKTHKDSLNWELINFHINK